MGNKFEVGQRVVSNETGRAGAVQGFGGFGGAEARVKFDGDFIGKIVAVVKLRAEAEESGPVCADCGAKVSPANAAGIVFNHYRTCTYCYNRRCSSGDWSRDGQNLFTGGDWN